MTGTPGQQNPLSAGLTSRRRAEPCTFVVFGATGDLAARKLMPALYNLAREGHLPQRFAVVGVSRRDKSDDEYREDTRKALEQHSRAKPAGEDEAADFLARVFYQRVQFDEPAHYPELGERLDGIEERFGLGGNRIYYLSTAPDFFAPITNQLRENNLVRQEDGGPWRRVIVEKPFGRDLDSARELNHHLAGLADERQIYRIDHYLGKETVQNILAFRFANAIFEPLWNNRYIEQVQITVAESIGMEGRRGQYYDTAGALRDMVQNHMLQLLCLTAMEAPASLEAESLRDEKVRLLRAIPLLSAGQVRERTVRGQYGPGSVQGKQAKGYREEELVDGESTTETYAALRLEVRNWRWAGTPFLLRHGKRLPKKASEVAVTFKQPPHQVYAGMLDNPIRSNTLLLRIQPDDGISISFQAKQPGLVMRLQPVKMDFRYGSSFGRPAPEAYERLILDALVGDRSLFTRGDEVEVAWKLVQGVLDGWDEAPPPEFPNYKAGTWGPDEADRLAAGLADGWRRL